MLLILTGIVLYVSFAYHFNREDFIKLFSLYTGLFLISFKLLQLEKNNFWLLAGTALLFRLIFITAIPNLSQDYVRFLWDGALILNGFNPYLFTPNEFLSETVIPSAQELIKGMGDLSASNYTSYPPVNQLLFTIAVFTGGQSILSSVIVMRMMMLLADLGILYFGRKLLLKLNLPSHRIFWYILNPFIIIELTGNLHFEGVMIFFLVWSLYLLNQRKWIWSAVLLGISVSVKLLPLLFLPFFYQYFIQKKSFSNFKILFGYYFIVASVVFLTFLPFLSLELVNNFSESIGLWFQKFEFNASFYYLIRWIGFQTYGYNIIGIAGKIMPIIVVVIIITLAFFRKKKTITQLITTMLFGLTAYFFLSTTVHPWYLATLLFLSIFSSYRFVLLWTFLIFLSYQAYVNSEYSEITWLIVLEYLIVIGYFVFEVHSNEFKKKKFGIP